MPTRITRKNPRTGRTELPWRNRDGRFVLGDPAHGAQKHHDKFAVKVATIEEVAALAQRGFSVRMTDGENPPSLISPEGLIIEEVAETEHTALFADTLPRPPFDREAVRAELRRALLVQASQIAHAGNPDAAAAFIGFPTESPHPYCEDDPSRVDLARFQATSYLDLAYDYAFQVGQYWRFGDDDAQDVRELVQGANPCASNGDTSPLSDPDGLCRRTADTAFGRWKLEQGYNLTLRELALLGQMKEAAVRNSFSKERIAIDRGEIDNAVALEWLKQRRDFIPTRTEGSHKARWALDSRSLLEIHPFAKAFSSILHGYNAMTVEHLAASAAVSVDQVAALVQGRPEPDLDALRRVGEVLELDVPHFVGKAVEASLRMQP